MGSDKWQNRIDAAHMFDQNARAEDAKALEATERGDHDAAARHRQKAKLERVFKERAIRDARQIAESGE